ncbi:protein disulfide-isomerase [Achaetomium macrosporum]|uniref:Protein disulfide-isomerase n=1 Tax=Achaetomium macrosporum TaxID=79813 RepID=A0AAN7CCH8_9PEZI|nr:protein disulfide-isomerase [Achaetomium macrosporum]
MPRRCRLLEMERDDNIVSFDCEKDAKYCRELDVASFPSIRLYHRDGRMDQYRGPWKAREAIRPYLLEADEHTMGPFTLLDDVVLVAHPHPDDWDFYDRFRTLAKQYRDRYSFVVAPPVSDTSSAVACYNNIDDVKRTASDLETEGALEQFIKLCAAPLIPELTTQNEAQYTSTGKRMLHYFTTTEAEKEAYRQELRPLAKKYTESLHFTIIDAGKYSEKLSAVGLEAGQKTGLALEDPKTGNIFPFSGNGRITATVVEAFLDEIASGKIQPWEREAGAGQTGSHDEL